MERKIVRNGFLLVLSQVVGRSVGFIYFIFLARNLTVESFGIYTWVLGFVYNFLPVADFGIERYILKHIPRYPEKIKDYFRDLLGLKIFLAAASFFLVVTLGLVMGLSGEKLASLLILSLVFLPHNTLHLITSFQNAQEKVSTGIASNLLFTILGAVLGFLAVKFNLPVIWLFATYLTAQIITTTIFAIRAKRLNLPLKPRLKKAMALQVWQECRFFAILVIMSNFYLRIPLITIGQTMGDYWSGIYGSVSKFLEAGALIPQAVALAVAPTFSRLLVQNKEQLKKIYHQTGLGVVAISLIPLVVFFFFGDIFLNLVYGPRYLPATQALKILGLVLPFYFYNYLAANIIENSVKIKKFVPWAVGHFLLVFILAVVFSLHWGASGGAASLLLGEGIRLIINRFFIGNILSTKAKHS